MAEDLKNQPAYKCFAYQDMWPAWEVVQDLCGGTLNLRQKGARYLPPEPAEKLGKDYQPRLSRAILFNAFERTKNGLAGMAFRREPKLAADVPEMIRGREAAGDQQKAEGWAENIDLAGSHWTVFSKELFTDALELGHSFIYVDMPPKLPEGATRADELAAGRRPYWVSYSADQALNWQVQPEYRTVALANGAELQVPTGRSILTQVTFYECGYEPDGRFGEQQVKKYRVLRPGYWELYRETTEGSDTNYVLESAGESSLSEIPVAVVYGRKTGMMTSKPPLLDLALINIAHFQKYSDYSEGLRMCIPQLCFKGLDPANQLKVIGHHTFHVVRPEGDVWFAEPTGAGLEPQRQDIQDLEEQMARLGLAVIASKKPQPEKTATEVSIDHLQSDSDLATAARSLKDGLELALKFTAQYEDPAATSGGSVEGLEIDQLTLSPEEVQNYSNMVAAGQLSVETLWEVLGRAGKLPENFDPKKEKQRIEQAAETVADMTLRKFEAGAGM